MTPQQLQQALPCTSAVAERWAPHIADVCTRFGLTTPRRQAFWLANVAHESASFARLAESLDYTADRLVPVFGAHRITPDQAEQLGRAPGRPAQQEAIANLVYGGAWGARHLGNTQPGDGWRFRGRGLIQTTGRSNHRELRPALVLAGYDEVPDFETEPELLELPKWAAAAAGHFWRSRGLHGYADAGDFLGVCRGINLGNPKSDGQPHGMPDRMARLARAQAALAEPVTTSSAAPAPPASAPPAPAPRAPITTPPGGEVGPEPEKPMAPLLIGLASSLIQAFAPLAQEKISKEIARHTDHPEVADQVSAAIIETAKAATGKADPIDAVSAAKADPAVMQQVERSAVAKLAELTPLLDKLADLDAQTWRSEEESRAMAAARAAGGNDDMAWPLLIGAFAGVAFVTVLLGTVVVIQLLKSGKADTEVWAALTGLIGWLTAKAGSIYDYRFGSSRGSSAKDVVIQQLQQQRTR